MNNLKDRFLQISYVFLTLVWLTISAGFIVYAFGFFPHFEVQQFLATRVGIILFYGLGSLSGLTGLYFLRKFIVSLKLFRTFVQESELGNIHISQFAVKELTREILKENLDIPSFSTSLSGSSEGVDIRVNAKVRSGADIGGLGEQVQRVLQKKIREKTGLQVAHVDFYTVGVGGEERKQTNDEEEIEGEEETKTIGVKDED